MADTNNGHKAKLTLAQLASYDDILTDALVDRAFFWTKIRKNRNKYISTRGILEDTVTSILLHDIVVAKDAAKAERALLELPGLKKYVQKLKSEREKEWFRRHLRKYISIYLPSCPFEVATTNRYTITTQEAAVSARKFISAGQTIKHLTGTLVPITREEEKDLDLTRRDFSIVMSSRKKTPSLFLGPARFANHDCNPNGRLVMRGPESMEIVAARDIDIGDEITVSYGENYFGLDNCECLCETCENALQSGWAPPSAQGEESDASPSETVEDPLASSLSDSQEQLDEQVLGPPSKRRKLSREPSRLRQELSAPGSPNPECLSPSSTQNINVPRVDPSEERGNACPSKNEGPESWQPGACVNGYRKSSSTALDDVSYFSSADDNSGGCPASTPATSVSGTCAPEGKTNSGQLTSAPAEKTETVHDFKDVSDGSVAAPRHQKLGGVVASDGDDEDLSDLSTSWEMDDTEMTVVKRDSKSSTGEKNKRVFTSVEPEGPTVRVPGDYTKTPKLLAQRYDRWVDCQTCSSWFVQSDAYLTRKECPRCERHSKLYGYQWPKTDKEGRYDTEERVVDHRTIHRFITSDAESRIQRRGRGLSHGNSQTPDPSDVKTETPDPSDAGDGRRSTRATRRAARESLFGS